MAGTALAIRMLHYATKPQDITLLEERDEYRHGGIAYSASGLGWEHMFNIQAGRMSAFREDPDDFINWANKEADRKKWPDEWKEVRFHESSAAPRRIYQDYLKTRLEQAKVNTMDGVNLHVAHGKAVDLVEHGDIYADVSIKGYKENIAANPIDKIIKADQIALATGHEEQEPNIPSVEMVESHGRQVKRVNRPYSVEGRQAMLDLDKNATVHIKGSFLTAYDEAATLLKNGHKGYIIFVSRGGQHPWDYPKNHKHEVIKLPEPEFVKANLPINERIDLAFRELDETLQARAKAGASIQENNVLIERVLKAWEPHIATLMKKLPTNEAREFTKEVLGELAYIRTGILPEAADQIKKAMTTSRDGTFLQAMDIHDVDTFAEELRTRINIDNQICSLNTPELIIDSIQRQADYSKVQNPLWRKLMDERKAVVPHIKTGQGVQLDENYHVVNADEKASKIVYVTGIPAEGHERETKGRIGAFGFNLAAIKDQSFLIANHILDVTEHAHGTPVQHPVTTGDRQKAAPAMEGTIANLTTAYLSFFAAGIKRERSSARQAIEATETGLARTLRSNGIGEAATETIVAEVDREAKIAAVHAFTDISITPRELSSRLKRQIQ